MYVCGCVGGIRYGFPHLSTVAIVPASHNPFPMAMLLISLIVATLTAAMRDCTEADPPLNLPSCTVSTHGRIRAPC